MAITPETTMANRYGLETKVYPYGLYKLSKNGELVNASDSAAVTEAPLMTIDFANVTSYELEGDRVWATGGSKHSKVVGFNDPMEGTLTISTQLADVQLDALQAGREIPASADAVDAIIYGNDEDTSIPIYYTIVGDTLWQDKNGGKHSERILFHKVCPQRKTNGEYTGEGDPQEVEIVFDLMDDDNGQMISKLRYDASVTPPSGE